MAFDIHRDLPTTFLDELASNQATFTELQSRYTVAVNDLAHLALKRGLHPLNGGNEMVLYTLDGDIGDSKYDDYAHRLRIAFLPAPEKATSADIPSTALLPDIYNLADTAPDELKRQMKYGVYVTAISLQRHIHMQKMDPDATSFHARNFTQLQHSFSGYKCRYKVDPKGGTPEEVQHLPEFSALAEQAYGKVIGDIAQIAASEELRASYAAAAAKDAANPMGVVDNIPLFSKLARDIHMPSERIKKLVKAIEASGTEFGPSLTAQLMSPDIDVIANLGVIHSSTYYEKGRQPVSFDRRLQWVNENAFAFRTTLEGLIHTCSRQFGQLLHESLQTATNIATYTENMALDTQPPRATYVDNDAWQIVRAI